MKRSEINGAVRRASRAFRGSGWFLPPNPRWDVTDFGLGDFVRHGLVLVNLAERPEYCEKIMYAGRGQVTPKHFHKAKKEDILHDDFFADRNVGRFSRIIEDERPAVRLVSD